MFLLVLCETAHLLSVCPCLPSAAIHNNPIEQTSPSMLQPGGTRYLIASIQCTYFSHVKLQGELLHQSAALSQTKQYSLFLNDQPVRPIPHPPHDLRIASTSFIWTPRASSSLFKNLYSEPMLPLPYLKASNARRQKPCPSLTIFSQPLPFRAGWFDRIGPGIRCLQRRISVLSTRLRVQ